MDDLQAFALRIAVSRAKLNRIEKGDLSVSIGRYYQAAQVLGLEQPFAQLLKPPVSLLDNSLALTLSVRCSKNTNHITLWAWLCSFYCTVELQEQREILGESRHTLFWHT